MEKNNILYTYGKNNVELRKFIEIIKNQKINCVVDVRCDTSTIPSIGMLSFTSKSDLKEILIKENIYYLDFYELLGSFPLETYNKKGNVIYDKVTKTDNYLKGIKRLCNGIEKGYSIIILEKEDTIYKSLRYNVIGRYLAVEGYNVYHYSDNNYLYSHQQLLSNQSNLEMKRQQKKEKANTLGRIGEEIAAQYLRKNGFQILDKNWNLHKGCELDIVARKDNTIHFIEVKTRSSDRYGAPQIAINYNKFKNICKAAQEYRYRNGCLQIEHQIDSIAIIYKNEDDYNLEYFPDIRMFRKTNYNLPYRNR